MKKAIGLLCCLIAFLFVGCEKFDEDYGKSMTNHSGDISSQSGAKAPEIKSDDEVMPAYLDISLYDEENYSSIYFII